MNLVFVFSHVVVAKTLLDVFRQEDGGANVVLSLMKQDGQWYFYSFLENSETAPHLLGENLYRLTEEEALELTKLFRGYGLAPSEYLLTRRAKGALLTTLAATTGGCAVFRAIDRLNESASSFSLYYTKDSFGYLVSAAMAVGCETNHYNDKEVVDDYITKAFSPYREKINSCPRVW